MEEEHVKKILYLLNYIDGEGGCWNSENKPHKGYFLAKFFWGIDRMVGLRRFWCPASYNSAHLCKGM